MIKLIIWGTDKTEYLEHNSVRITEQLSNRANTCDFKINWTTITSWTEIKLYEWFYLTEEASSWQAVLNVNNTFENQDKFEAWDVLTIDVNESWEKDYTISSIDHDAKTITLTTNLTSTLSLRTYCWRKVFWWTIVDNPDEEIDHNWTLSYQVRCTDYTKLFDNKLVVDTYEDMYPREIFGRIVYDFVATNSTTSLDTFESAWTESGTALAMGDDTDDFIEWTKSQTTGTSWSWTAIWTKTIWSTDISSETAIRFWWKVTVWNWSSISEFKVRIGSDSSNYYEFDVTNIWIGYEICWNYETHKFIDWTQTWSPDLSAVTHLQYRITTTATIADTNLNFDYIFGSDWWFSIQNCFRWIAEFDDAKIQYLKPTVAVDKICKLSNIFWYIDYNKDLHVFENYFELSRFNITDSSTNYSDLSYSTDITTVKNRQTVRWWEAPSETQYTQIEVADWEKASWRLDYKPKELEVSVDTWWWYVQKTVWVENLVDETAYDFVYNFNEKVIRTANIATPSNWDKVKLVYYPFKSIRVRAQDLTSITSMKALVWWDWIFDWAVINDYTIKTFEEARERATAELDQYKNPMVTIMFSTEKDWLHPWQLINIVDSSRSISDDYLIQKVSIISKENDIFQYYIQASSTLFWIIEFFQLLLKRSDKIQIDENEIVDLIQNVDWEIQFTDAITTDVNSYIYTAWDKWTYYIDFQWITWTITADWYVTPNSGEIQSPRVWVFWWGETWSISIDTSSNHVNWQAMKIVTDTWWAWLSIKSFTWKRIVLKPNTEYTLQWWIEIPTTLTNLSWSDYAYIRLREYANKRWWAVLATTTIWNKSTIQDFFKSSTTVTTNGSTWFWEIEVAVVWAAWTVSFADIWIIDSTADSESNPAVAGFSETQQLKAYLLNTDNDNITNTDWDKIIIYY